MPATSVVCPECQSSVAPGHLACQVCGTLVASVVGSERRPSWAGSASDEAEIDEDRPIASARADDPAGVEIAAAPASTATAVAVEPEPTPKRGPRRLTRPKAPAGPAKARYVKSPPANEPPPVDTTALFGPVPTVAPPILHDWSEAPISGNGAAAHGTATNGTGTVEPVAPAAAPVAPAAAPVAAAAAPVAGAYLAPSATYVAPPIAQRTPASAPSWPAAPGMPAAAAAPSFNGTAAAAPRQPTAAAREARAARRVADWLIIGGSIMAMVSFLLPWANDGVIGSFGTGFTAGWGLANPGHFLLIALAGVVLALHVVDVPVPDWFRSSALPLLVGGLLAGLAFAYYARPAGGGAGVAVLLAGAVVLIVGGMLASRPERHAPGAPTV